MAQLAPPEIGYGKPPPQNKGFAAAKVFKKLETQVSGFSPSGRTKHLGEDELQRIVGTSALRRLHQWRK